MTKIIFTNAHIVDPIQKIDKIGTITIENDDMVINGDKVRVLSERDPSKLPWGKLGVDVVIESTGFFTSKAKAQAHINGGAKKVIISAPGGSDVDATVVQQTV